MNVIESLAKGGPIVFILLAASVASLAMFIERLWFTRAGLVNPPRLKASLLEYISQGKYQEASAVAAQSQSPVAILADTLLKHSRRNVREIQEKLEIEGGFLIRRIRRGLGLLSAVATVSPLLGLLGTVTGMVQVFKAVEMASEPRIPDLAGGIWEALLTTVTGLSVAIPSYIAFRLLNSRMDKVAESLEGTASELLDALEQHRTGGTGLE